GDHSIFPIAYTKGKAPAAENDIALSTLYADDMGYEVGETLTLVIGDVEKKLIVSGIYSDITNGGKTAKAVFSDQSAGTMWSIVSAKLYDPALVAVKVKEYSEAFDYAKTSDIDEYVKQTFGSTISAVKTASYVAIVVAIAITLLISLLFIRMLVAKDRYCIAVMNAFGYTSTDVKVQFISRSIFILIIGVLLGTILANTLGELLAGLVISSFGASTFEFTIDPISAYLLSPLLMAITVIIATLIGVAHVVRIKISNHIKE